MVNKSNWLKIREVYEGLHPSEVIIAIQQANGTEAESIVSRRSIVDGAIDIGYPVGSKPDGSLLVELPHETSQGFWRVWVRPEQVR